MLQMFQVFAMIDAGLEIDKSLVSDRGLETDGG